MAQQSETKFAYELRSILKNAPTASGVYTLESPSGCVYVGEAEDICANLLVHLHDDNPCLDQKDPRQFTFEAVPPGARLVRQAELVRALHPVCHRREGLPECEGCSLAKKAARDN
ncbi:MAG TPA: hypothetical protein VLH58_03605 [Candidatus Methylomirabilis sp.]|nr:hypothetical protein [Candidatus Methylomirabilis sp.]HSC70410.1 hypothetical protein [Candidatus Methylomirabilis sp.]